uniref:RHS repeat domain-containing protein n=1 Tax=Hymenobacter cellulosivorans TaxID=2932249 RepID=UPI0035CB3B7D
MCQHEAVGNLFRTLERTDRQYSKGGQLREADGTRYQYDAEGNLVRKSLANGQQWHYAWDGAGQLISVTRPDGYAVRPPRHPAGALQPAQGQGRLTQAPAPDPH